MIWSPLLGFLPLDCSLVGEAVDAAIRTVRVNKELFIMEKTAFPERRDVW